MYTKVTDQAILVTGGAGFIGSNLCESFLKNGNRVVCLDNFATGKRENVNEFTKDRNFTLIEGDICDYDTCVNALKGIDLVCHQAALGSVPRSIENPIRTNDVNVSGFLNMLTASKEKGIKRFVYAASSSTYGDSTALPKLEDNIGNPLSPYGVTKLVNELYARVFSQLYGLQVIGLRYFNVFGRRQDPLGAYAAAIPKFIKAFLDNESPIIYGDGTQSRDFTYIENVLQANHLALSTNEPDAFNQVFNVACGERIELKDLIQILKDKLAEIDASIGKVEILYGEERKGDVKHSLASIEKAQKLLGYAPTHTYLQGIEESINWYKENL
jgi:UDP-N-acetylglucosamine 4-epimerase